MMNDLATLGKMVPIEDQNSVSVFAGNTSSSLSLVFSGSILQSWGDYREQPNVCCQVIAVTGASAALQSIPPTSVAGSADVVAILSALAKQMGFTFQNNGVSGVRLSNPYLPGTALQQAQAAASHAGIAILFDDGKMAIWPNGGARAGEVPLISPATGLVGYPSFTQFGLDLRTLYNPAIVCGGQVKVQSSLSQASGTWNVYKLTHSLQAMTPGGEWFSDLRMTTPGLAAPVE